MNSKFKERDLEDWLWLHPEELFIDHWIGRQVPVMSGIIDLLGYHPYDKNPLHLSLLVVELKNVIPDSKAILQVCRYAHDIEQTINILPSYRGLLVQISKMIVGRFTSLPSNIRYEALATDVSIFSFENKVDYSIDINRDWMLTPTEYDDSKNEFLSNLLLAEEPFISEEIRLDPFKKFIEKLHK